VTCHESISFLSLSLCQGSFFPPFSYVLSTTPSLLSNTHLNCFRPLSREERYSRLSLRSSRNQEISCLKQVLNRLSFSNFRLLLVRVTTGMFAPFPSSPPFPRCFPRIGSNSSLFSFPSDHKLSFSLHLRARPSVFPLSLSFFSWHHAFFSSLMDRRVPLPASHAVSFFFASSFFFLPTNLLFHLPLFFFPGK